MFKPLLAEKADLSIIEYPIFASPKYDGYRCIIDTMGNPVSRNLKLIPNAYVVAKLREMKLPQLDGELLTYTGDKVDEFSVVQSKLSSRSGRPDFRFMVFDDWTKPNDPYVMRNGAIRSWFADHRYLNKYLSHVDQELMFNEEQVLDYEAQCLAAGWEGIMLRSGEGRYKFGRSTTREGILLKLKRFFDDEATVISCHELMHNANEATTDALGHTVRSSHQANMHGMDVLGKFTVRWREVEFDVGTGFNAEQRQQYWRTAPLLVGRKITFKYQSIGPNGKPRFPVFLGFRNDV